MEIKNLGISQELFDYIVKSVKDTPFYRLLGINVNALGPGYAEMSITTREHHTNPLGKIHGGLLFSLADSAMGNSIRSLGLNGVTVDCTNAIAAPAASGQTITARAKVLKPGKKIILTEAKVYAGDKILVNSQGTFFRIGDIEVTKAQENIK